MGTDLTEQDLLKQGSACQVCLLDVSFVEVVVRSLLQFDAGHEIYWFGGLLGGSPVPA